MMHSRIVICNLLACCVFLSAKCNNEANKQTQEAPQQNVVENIAPESTPVDSTLAPPDPGMLKVDMSYIKEKIDSLSKLIEQNPKEPDYYIQRGDFKIAGGDTEGACEDYKMSKSLGNKKMQSLIDKHCK